MHIVFTKPSLGICSSVWPLGNNKDFGAAKEAYFQNTGKRVSHARIGNVPTGPARLNIATNSNGLDAVGRLSLL